MKTSKLFSALAISIIALLAVSCADDWNNHYQQKEQLVENENIAIVNQRAVEFLHSETSLSSSYSLLDETGLVGEINTTAQLHTVLVVNNSVSQPEGIADMRYFARTHVASVALSPSHLHDGMRVMMLNGKYLNITMKERTPATRADSTTGGYNIAFNGINVTRITKVTDGYIYELENYINAPQSMWEIIKNLDDDYSIFRELVKDKVTMTFDKAASLPLGVDKSGNYIYDSIFVETFPYFESRGFNLASESLTATMLLPNNELVENAIATAKEYLQASGVTRHDSILENWIFQSAFFDKKYEQVNFETTVDFTSVFKKQWRNTVQQVDFDSRMTMSNGVAYKVKYLKIPINVLIWRLKDYFKWYEFMTSEQKAEYFKETNLVFSKMNTDVAAWTGIPTMLDMFPYIENRVIYYNLDSIGKAKGEWELDFTAVRCKDNGDGSYTMTPFGIPPGEYDLCFGFKEKMSGDWDIYFNDEYMLTISQSQLTSTTFHYDRNGQGYPEFYEDNKTKWSTAGNKPPATGTTKPANYDRDGGKVGVITITGDGPQPVRFTIKGKNTAADKQVIFHHWCLRPTKNCY